MAMDDYELADVFFKRHLEHRAEARGQSEAANPKQLKIRRSIMAAIVSLHQRVQGRRYKNTDVRMHLIAQYIQGIEVSYITIVEGLYAQAANLQKQQIETLAAMEEHGAGTRTDGKTPNPKNIGMQGLRSQYGALNNAAHPSKAEIVESLCHFEEGERQGPTTIPQFNQEYCEPLLANHNVYLLYLWRQMSNLFKVVFDIEQTEEDRKPIEFAINELLALGSIALTKE